MRSTEDATPILAEMGAAIRSARKSRSWGVRELARRVGVSPPMISSWELGYRRPKPLDVACILGALGVVGEEKSRILGMALVAELNEVKRWTATDA